MINSDLPPESHPAQFWLRKWISISAAGAVAVTLLDSFLLQQKHDLFTGGFLSHVHTKGLGDIIGFILSSLLTDISLLSFLVALGLWLSSFTRLRGVPRSLMVLAMATSPVFVANFLSYKLAAYLGDLFNLETMFDLTGKSVLEILAVGFPQLISSALIILGVLISLTAGLLVLNKCQRGRPENAPPKIPIRSIFLRSIILFLVGLIITTFARIQSDVLEYGLRRKPSGQLLGTIVAFVSDFDRDGYGLLRLPSDPNPFNPKIFPYAVEIPGNGIDENGVGGDLPLESARYFEKTTHKKAWRFKPDIVLIMLESFRADIIGTVYNGKQITPVLNKLATKGISAQHAYSHNGYTVQSRHHVFSGSLANLRPNSLIDDFKNNGYQVAYFSGQDESFGGPKMGIGFERADIAYDARVDPGLRFTKFSTPGSLGLSFQILKEKVTTFLEERPSRKPLFLYVNFIDTHFPYHHVEVRPLISDRVLKRAQIGPDRVEDLQAMYFNTAANIDRAIGEVIEKVRDVTGKTPAVIVTSDHGESLFDEGFLGHGYVINDVQTRIPLIVLGLPMKIKEPFGQSELRDALAAALVLSPTETRLPVLEANPAGKVFQYTGSLRHPTQIAFTQISRRIRYHFRTDRVQIDSGAWQRLESLEPAVFQSYLELIHFWESMILAQDAKKTSHQ